MARGRRASEDTASERRCIVSGQAQPKAGLIRFVLAPNGQVVPDILQKMPGRGMWLSADRAAIAEAARGKAFARAARQAVAVEPDLLGRLDKLLSERLISLVALSRKAGEAIAGYEKVKAWLEDGTAVLLVQASDGSERGRAKLRPPDGPETLISVLTGAELGAAFGREKVIHGALAAGGLTNRVVEEAARLAGVRAPDGGHRPV